MTLLVTFSDGSNPWLSLPTDRQTIAKHWRRWMKYHPRTAWPEVRFNGWICEYNMKKSRIWVYPDRPGATLWRDGRQYKHIGHALRALERLGGADK